MGRCRRLRRALSSTSPVPLHSVFITKCIRGLLILAGFSEKEAELRSGHSGRRVGTTLGSLCGIAQSAIFAMGLWRNPFDSLAPKLMPQVYNDNRLLEADVARFKICDAVKKYCSRGRLFPSELSARHSQTPPTPATPSPTPRELPFSVASCCYVCHKQGLSCVVGTRSS